MKILIVIGTRPEAIKMYPVIKELKKFTKPIICVTGQHRELLHGILREFKIKPHIDLNVMEENQTLSGLSIRIFEKIDKVLRDQKPDLVLVQGDTTTAMITALACYYHKIKLGHIEAGLRSYDKFNPFPEEINRKIITVLADYHFAPSKDAEYALNLELDSKSFDNIYITGNTVIDALKSVVGKDTPKKKHILITVHRRENFGMPVMNIYKAVLRLSGMYPKLKFLWVMHKNKIIDSKNVKNIKFIKPQGYKKFIKLINDSYFIITDSGGIQEEAAALGKPVLIVRNKTERLEVIGTTRVIGTETDDIVSEAQNLFDKKIYSMRAQKKFPYGKGNAAKKICKIIRRLR